jgi:hypothetical protein
VCTNQIRRHKRHNNVFLNWNAIENSIVRKSVGDLLTIMDTCYAGNLGQVHQPLTGRTYDYIGACERDDIISGGEMAFSLVLADALDSLYEQKGDEGFMTGELIEKVRSIIDVKRQESKRKGVLSNPILVRRFDKQIDSRPHVSLLPIRHRRSNIFSNEPIKGYLNLRLELKQDSLTDSQIIHLSEALSKAVRDCRTVPTRRIDWNGITPARIRLSTMSLLIIAVLKFKKTKSKDSTVNSKLPAGLTSPRASRDCRTPIESNHTPISYRSMPWPIIFLLMSVAILTGWILI